MQAEVPGHERRRRLEGIRERLGGDEGAIVLDRDDIDILCRSVDRADGQQATTSDHHEMDVRVGEGKLLAESAQDSVEPVSRDVRHPSHG